jgi:hypothetical protein
MANNKGMAYLLVGGSHHWGKSKTLNALTGGVLRYEIDIISKKDGKNYPFFIRHMSNTDKTKQPDSFMDFIKTTTHPNIITAFSVHDPSAQTALQILSAKYRLRCFVLQHRWGHPAQTVTAQEQALLARYAVPGGIYVYAPQNSAATHRAAVFHAYMDAETPF